MCLRCGLCCIIPSTGKDCKHLIRLKSGKTLCRIFNKRLGQIIHKEMIDGKPYVVKCVLRKDWKQNYDGCLFNE